MFFKHYKIISGPLLKQGDDSRHITEVAFYRTDEDLAKDIAVVDWFETNYLRNTKFEANVVDNQVVSFTEVDGQPEEELEALIKRWMANPANKNKTGDFRKADSEGGIVPPTTTNKSHINQVGSRPKMMALKASVKNVEVATEIEQPTLKGV